MSNKLDQILSNLVAEWQYDEAKADLLKWRDEEVVAELKRIYGWVDRNHYQPVLDESDRWTLASAEIMAEIDDRIKQLEAE